MDEAMDKWEKSLEERLGRNLRKKRVQAGWSLYQMSQITGVGRQTLLHYEWANRSPSIGKNHADMQNHGVEIVRPDGGREECLDNGKNSRIAWFWRRLRITPRHGKRLTGFSAGPMAPVRITSCFSLRLK